jgi:hypothetical protein
VALAVVALVLLGADARAAQAAATWTMDVFPSRPRAGDLVTVQLRPFWSLPRNPPALFPKSYPWAVVAISSKHRQTRVQVRRTVADPYVWSGSIRFRSRGVWTLCVLNASAIGRCIPQSTGWQQVRVRTRRARVAVWQRLERPFHVPTVAAGTRCPTSGRDPNGDLNRFPGFTGTAWGDGPAFPAGLDTVAGAPTLHYADPIPPQSVFFGSAWFGNKVLWVVDASYAGPLLIRGRQVDGPNLLRFDTGEVPPRELRIPPSKTVRGRGSYTRVRAPGCYAYQIDGLGFSKVIVFKAQPAR